MVTVDYDAYRRAWERSPVLIDLTSRRRAFGYGGSLLPYAPATSSWPRSHLDALRSLAHRDLRALAARESDWLRHYDRMAARCAARGSDHDIFRMWGLFNRAELIADRHVWTDRILRRWGKARGREGVSARRP